MAPLTYYLSLGYDKSQANFLPSNSGRWLETNIIFHMHPVALRAKKKKCVQYPECGCFGGQAAPQAVLGHRQVSALLGRVQKAIL